MDPNLPLGCSIRDLEPRDIEAQIEAEWDRADQEIEIERNDL